MANINGTNNDDDIDVANDSGTLNGGSSVSPVDNINARQGDDTISIDDSTISGRVRGQGGNDDISITDSTISGDVLGNGGADTISVEDGSTLSQLLGGGGSDDVSVSDSSVNRVNLGNGADSLNFVDSTTDEGLFGGGGNDTISVEGSTVDRVNLGNNNDTLNFVKSSSTDGLFGGGGTDALNLPVGTEVTDDNAGFFVVGLGDTYTLTSGTFELPTGQIVSYSQFETGSAIPCFTAGTLIATEHGEKLVQDICVGDRVLTMDCGLQPVRWIGSRTLSEIELQARKELCPIVIRKGALGMGYPAQELSVSPQHRVLIRSRIAERMFGEMEVLVPAVKLLELDGVERDGDSSKVQYVHLMFDTHQIVFSNGLPSESLYAGQEALKSIDPAARLELLTLFPELRDMDHRPPQARTFVKKSGQISNLIARHNKNGQPLLSNGR
ncbi:hypothetical protein ROA7450_02138 [Roseovarius albus]|uniref:Hint domain-containing protein n=1 Tax=Roseovarius albus TaxID=1247867 RepID=A0A1X6Z983_9RHOB|nr:Hint domain-containing protein [Roseovarius albus]SLN44216.1 hypothetical protein ROA7450_02138 [Roseovarius albus]